MKLEDIVRGGGLYSQIEINRYFIFDRVIYKKIDDTGRNDIAVGIVFDRPNTKLPQVIVLEPMNEV